MLNQDLLQHWVMERINIYIKKKGGESPPWTDDPILQNFKFTNVNRENDRTSKWVAKNWREPLAGSPDLWFAMTISVLINWPDTLEKLPKYGWNPQKFIDTIVGIQDSGGKAFSGAYIVSTNGRSMDKAEYLAHYVLDPLWKNRADIRPRKDDTLADFYSRLVAFDGIGSFIAAQVIAATKYADPILMKAEDWLTWAASGPGSRRGMERLYGLPVKGTIKEKVWYDLLEKEVQPFLMRVTTSMIHAQDCQNCLCEFDKYMRVKLGQGFPRSRYPGGAK